MSAGQITGECVYVVFGPGVRLIIENPDNMLISLKVSTRAHEAHPSAGRCESAHGHGGCHAALKLKINNLTVHDIIVAMIHATSIRPDPQGILKCGFIRMVNDHV